MRHRLLRFVSVAVFFGTTQLLFAATATELVPRTAPRGARCIVAGSGLDSQSITVTFSTSAANQVAAAIVSRSADMLEIVVPAPAASGSVRVSSGSVLLGTFTFTVASDPQFASVTTIVASGAGREPVKSPVGNVFISGGTVYVADSMHHEIKAISLDGTVRVFAGSGRGGLRDGTGTSAELRGPEGVAYDAVRGILYVADTDNHAVRRITADGTVTTLAGSGRRGDSDGAGVMAEFTLPAGIAVDAMGTIYVADTGNHRIKRITPSGVVTTIAGTGRFGSADGTGALTQFHSPEGIAAGADGSVYVADTGNDVIRRITNGIVTTIAGGVRSGYVNGPANAALFNGPAGIAFDDLGNLLIADTRNHVIRKLTLTPGAETVTTIAGTGAAGQNDGAASSAQFRNPSGVSAAGSVLVSDTGNDALRALYPAVTLTDVYPRSGDPSGGGTVRLFGSGFAAGQTTVTFGGVPAQVTYVASTELLVTAPAGTVGASTIVVATPGGTASLRDTFNYVPPFVSLRVTPSTSSLSPGQTVQMNASGVLTGGGTTDVTARVTWTSSNANIATIDAAGLVRAIQPGGATIMATYGSLSASAIIDVATPVPPDPATIAPPLDPSTGADVFSATSFLYSGPNAIQQGVAPGTIDPLRVSILRGRVLSRDGSPLAGARVRVAGHPEFGSTTSRADGAWDLVTNGGGPFMVAFDKTGYMPAERAVSADFRDFAQVEDVVLVTLDTAVTAVAVNSPALQVARGASVEDAAGPRRATLIIPPNTGAVVTLPNGSQQALTSLTLRASEYTVGTSGPNAMPAPLPVSSGYTHCVELSVDEAIALGARNVLFDRVLYYYVENFLGFPVGTRVPAAYYDREEHAWVPTDDGRVIRIISVDGGRASVDTTGDGVAETDAALAQAGFSPEELQQLATLYTAGTALWRAPVEHFSPIDLNFPAEFLEDAILPSMPLAIAGNAAHQDSACQVGSIIECENQTLGESLPITGTPFTLNYRSDRSSARRGARQLIVSLSGATVPQSLKGIRLEVAVAGQRFTRQFPPLPNQKFTYEWDGRDAYGRPLNGRYPVSVRIGYDYPLYYRIPESVGRAFAQFGSATGPVIAAPRDGTRWQVMENVVQLGTFVPVGFGGWTLSAQHTYQSDARALHMGDGRIRNGEGLPLDIVPFAGGGGGLTSGVPALGASLGRVADIVVAPDGTTYLQEDYMVARIDHAGIINVIVNRQNARGFSGDDGPAVSAQIDPGQGGNIAAGPDGSLYIADLNNFRIRRVDRFGYISTFAGNGTREAVENVHALDTGMVPMSVEVAPDGTVYYGGGGFVRKITPDGMIHTVAGFGFPDGTTRFRGPSQPMQSPALQTFIPHQVNALRLDRDGNLYIVDFARILVLRPNGFIDTIAGTVDDYQASLGDGGPALDAHLEFPHSIVFLEDGSLLVTERTYIRRITPDGMIHRFAGSATPQSSAGGLLTRFLSFPSAARMRDDSLLIGSFASISKVSSSLPGFDLNAVAFPEADGSVIYHFNSNGRHLETVHAATLERIYGFEYDPNGALSAVTDWHGQRTQISRSGSTISIRAPGGATTVLETNADGYLASARTPAGRTTRFTYSSEGLMTSFISPEGRTSSFDYDDAGLLVQHRDARHTRTLEHTTTAAGEEVTVRSSSGRFWTYLRERPQANGNRRQVNRDSSGLSVTTVVSADSTSQTVTAPGGISGTQTAAADSRFGMLAPVVSSSTHLGTGLDQSIAASRSTSTNAAKQTTQQVDTLLINGRSFRSVYQPLSRTATITTPAGRTITQTLDAHQQVTRTEMPGIFPITVEYDGAGLARSVTQGTQTLSLDRDSNGDVLSYTLGTLRTTYQRDADGWVTAAVLPGGRSISFDYDDDGNLLSLTPPGRGAHLFQYSTTGLVEKYTTPSGAMTSFQYTSDGDLSSVIQPDQSTVAFHYEADGQLDSVETADGSFDFTYDDAGFLTRIGSPSGVTVSYARNGGALTATTWAGAVAGSVAFGYDNALRVSSESVNGAAVPFGYDSDGLRTSAGALTLRRDPANGLLLGTTLAAISDTLSYDSFGTPSSVSVTANGLPIFSESYTRDDDGRISTVAQGLDGINTTTGYDYDDAGRLSRVRLHGTIVAEYDYDSNGNRTAYRAVGVSNTGSYDGDDRLLTYGDASYTYTASGQLAQKTIGGETTTYTYDAFGSLVRAAIPGRLIEYVNDGEHRRVAKKVDGMVVQQFLYSDPLRVVAELSPTGDVVSRFVYASRLNVPDYMFRDGRTYRFVCDLRGSVRLVVDALAGTVIQRLDYDAFGNVTADTNPEFQPFGFAGGIYDRDTGLVRFGARDYDPHTGRFTAKDPIGFSGGSSNLYTYTFNDPVNFIDPSGLLTLPLVGWVDIGESAGSTAMSTYADILTDPNAAWYEKVAAGVGGFLSALWTPCTSDATFATLSAAYTANAYVGRSFWQYYPSTNPAYQSRWMTRGSGWGSPYTLGDEAVGKLALPRYNTATAVREVPNSWRYYIAGPRSVAGANGRVGGGVEYFRGWGFPD